MSRAHVRATPGDPLFKAASSSATPLNRTRVAIIRQILVPTIINCLGSDRRSVNSCTMWPHIRATRPPSVDGWRS
jgi:hypothetical protein